MSDRAARMKTAKRRINTDKHERVTAVIAQIKEEGRGDQSKRRSSLGVRGFTGRS